MYTEETKAILEALHKNEKRLKKQQKQLDKIFANFDKKFNKLLLTLRQ